MNQQFKERERIIFLHDIPGGLDNNEDIAKKISKDYPQLLVFSDAKPLNISENLHQVIQNTEIYDPTEFIAGAHIYKNGVRYSLVRGICPGKNTIKMNNNVIELQLDKLGFLRLISYPINSGYFYVGPYNPLTKGYLIQHINDGESSNEYEVAENNDGNSIISFYDSAQQILNETFDINDLQGITKLMPIVGYDDNIEPEYAYIFTPKKWLNSILLSNDLGIHEIPSNSSELSSIMLLTNQINLDESNIYTNQDIIIDGVEYVLLKTKSKCEAIRIFYKYDINE